VRRFLGFTLVEMLIVIIVIAVLTAIAIPKFASAPLRSKEANLRHNLKLIRDAEDRCEADTGLVVKITELATKTAPLQGWIRGKMGTAWLRGPLKASDWRGPYLNGVPVNPFTGNATVDLGIESSSSVAWTNHSNQNYNSSDISFPSTILSSEGTEYRTW